MNWVAIGLGAAIFVITAAETIVQTFEGRADRQSTYATHNRFSLRAASWATVFEAILFADIFTIARQGGWLILPVLVAAYTSKYWVLERRRKKWLQKKFTKKAGEEVRDEDSNDDD